MGAVEKKRGRERPMLEYFPQGNDKYRIWDFQRRERLAWDRFMGPQELGG